MANKEIGNRIKETSSTTGTGALTLSGAVSGFLPFSALGGLPKTVDYVIEWDGGFEVGIGRIETGGTTLTRVYVMSKSPSTLHSSTTNQQVSLPAGAKTISLVSPDYCALAVMPPNFDTGTPGVSIDPPIVGDDYAIAAGQQAMAVGVNTLAVGFNAYASHLNSRVFGNGASRGANSVAQCFAGGNIVDQVIEGTAVSGTPVVMTALQTFQDLAYMCEVLAIACNTEGMTPHRVIKRRIFFGGTSILYASADEVLYNAYGTVPTLSHSIAGVADGDGMYPIKFTGTSSGASPVWWRVYLRHMF